MSVLVGHVNQCYLEETDGLGWNAISCNVSLYVDPPFSDVDFPEEALPSLRKILQNEYPTLQDKFIHIREMSFGVEDYPGNMVFEKVV